MRMRGCDGRVRYACAGRAVPRPKLCIDRLYSIGRSGHVIGEGYKYTKKLMSERTASVIAKLHNLNIEGLLTSNAIATRYDPFPIPPSPVPLPKDRYGR
jgi:hypothetical protein